MDECADRRSPPSRVLFPCMAAASGRSDTPHRNLDSESCQDDRERPEGEPQPAEIHSRGVNAQSRKQQADEGQEHQDYSYAQHPANPHRSRLISRSRYSPMGSFRRRVSRRCSRYGSRVISWPLTEMVERRRTAAINSSRLSMFRPVSRDNSSISGLLMKIVFSFDFWAGVVMPCTRNEDQIRDQQANHKSPRL